MNYNLICIFHNMTEIQIVIRASSTQGEHYQTHRPLSLIYIYDKRVEDVQALLFIVIIFIFERNT